MWVWDTNKADDLEAGRAVFIQPKPNVRRRANERTDERYFCGGSRARVLTRRGARTDGTDGRGRDRGPDFLYLKRGATRRVSVQL